MGRRLSWVAPANTPNSTGYPGDFKFLGRCDCFVSIYPTIFETKMWRLFVTRMEVPRLPVTWIRELERR